MLQNFTRDVRRRVDDTLVEVEILGDEMFAVVHNKNAADVKLNAITPFLGLEEVERGALRNKQNPS